MSDLRTLEASASPGVAPVEPIIELQNLSVGWRDADDQLNIVVDSVSLQVAQGEVLGVVGQSGSGKSQLCAALLKLTIPPLTIVSGKVLFHGRDLLPLTERQLQEIRGAKIGLVSSDARRRLHPMLTIGTQISDVLRAHSGVSRQEAKERVVRMLSDVGLPDARVRYNSYPHELSGGMAQRVLIAMALICGPEVIVADNPTFGLDVTIQLQILELMQRLVAEHGTSMIIATHELGIVAKFCDDLAVLDEGRVVEGGPTRTVLRNPATTFTQALIASTQSSGVEDVPT